MNLARSPHKHLSRWPLLLLASALALAALNSLHHFLFQAAPPATVQAAPHDVWPQYLPMVLAPSPEGTYDCIEYEFGMAWTSEVVTLFPGGRSQYEYPGGVVVTGTWVYTATTAQVGFTNFRWSALTYLRPDFIRASEYITPGGFEIAVYCTRE